jgi:hypothetical protein
LELGVGLFEYFWLEGVPGVRVFVGIGVSVLAFFLMKMLSLGENGRFHLILLEKPFLITLFPFPWRGFLLAVVSAVFEHSFHEHLVMLALLLTQLLLRGGTPQDEVNFCFLLDLLLSEGPVAP